MQIGLQMLHSAQFTKLYHTVILVIPNCHDVYYYTLADGQVPKGTFRIEM